MMNRDKLIAIIDRISKSLKARGMVTRRVEIRERSSKYEVYINLDANPAEVDRIKIIISKYRYKYRVFSGLTSIDLAIKRILAKELSNKGVKNEDTS